MIKLKNLMNNYTILYLDYQSYGDGKVLDTF